MGSEKPKKHFFRTLTEANGLGACIRAVFTLGDTRVGDTLVEKNS